MLPGNSLPFAPSQIVSVLRRRTFAKLQFLQYPSRNIHPLAPQILIPVQFLEHHQ